MANEPVQVEPLKRVYLISGWYEYEGHDVLAVRFNEEEAKKLVEELEKFNNPYRLRYGNKDYKYKQIPGCEDNYSYDGIDYEEIEDDYFVQCLENYLTGN